MNYDGFAHPVRAWLAGQDLGGEPAQLSTGDFERWLTAARPDPVRQGRIPRRIDFILSPKAEGPAAL